ncbi:ABC transporter ATP-binding protein [Enterococcus avium]|uniref:ABC transporter ATP-binding protein n=1 Tax=Enterococcus avium TaxID=33945 RepID=A0ABD5F6A0_ENTAV|nr:ABC transporter ATP-binding protein [Enterococcus avium]MDT2398023.1 ABC transporter ATP-binding protein [Enterococcus avium]MDT2434021.1 ABC transporter ATP-binding protein [Enterococcus avium]MDT2448420.1 ABC transporter ATP-binding protein [Enterococcus avium]MDT2464517.1 ABC transporter ATP-binding protein [Enterococcus avium]MDT2481940.1 ABC transporter ATP-binding protein [Enterococcus avium]
MILTIRDLVKHYNDGGSVVKAVDHIDLEVQKGDFVAIVGKSGSGKSTLLNLIGSLDRPDSGQVIIDGKNVFRMKDEQLAVFRRQKIGFIFQNYNLIPSLNVWENVILPIGLDNRRVNTAFVEDLLKTIGLSDRKKALPSMLSGGQQQRVAIARAIAAEPAIILADEPTGNLDTKTELEVMSLLKKSVEKFGQTLIMITHDEGIAQTADHIVHLEDGRVI